MLRLSSSLARLRLAQHDKFKELLSSRAEQSASFAQSRDLLVDWLREKWDTAGPSTRQMLRIWVGRDDKG